MAVITLYGDRIGLGPMHKDLTFWFLDWWNDPDIMLPLSGQIWPMTEEDIGEWYEKNAKRGDGSTVQFVVHDLEASRAIGMVTLFGINYRAQTAWASWFIGECEYWGKGRCTEAVKLLVQYAFDVLGLHHVIVGIHADNLASLRVAEKVGYKRIGVQRQAVRRRDGYVDAILLDILPEDIKGGS